MLIARSPIRWACRLVGRLRVVTRFGLVADLDTTISNVSPSAPICGGNLPWSTFDASVSRPCAGCQVPRN